MQANVKGRRIAVITGGSRGLGLETCRQLADKELRVVLTARRASEAHEAAERLAVDHIQLDVTDRQSVAHAASELRDRYGHVDVLVNNAGIAMQGFGAQIARETVAVNLLGAISTTDAVRPFLSDDAVIVMVSSGLGELSGWRQDRRRDFEDPHMSRERLENLMHAFIRDVEDGSYESKGWPGSAYRVSKAGLNAFTRLVARELATTAIRVNAVCPGWVRTDMGGARATRSVEEGARGIVWAATLSPAGPSGGFFRDGSAIPW
ncbi:MAG: SDR family NAD(P)-dependent oxidoreductase [Proteobacteria bacterium]|nr:SDR family NAD(P)-dependent oxidoreductase [Pseudomonadota bacterium]